MNVPDRIAELELQNAELRREHAELESIAGVGSYVLDVATGRWRSSEMMDRVFGIDAGYEHSVECWEALLHPDDRAMMVSYFRDDVLGRRQPFDKEYRIVRHCDGAVRWVYGRGMLEFDGQQRPVKMHGTIQDITERRQAEAALRESDALFSLFMRHSPVYTFVKEVTATESRVVRASDNFLNMVGIAGSDMVGKTMAELFPAEFAAKISADDWAVVSHGEVLKLEESFSGRHYNTIKFPIVQEGRALLAGYTIDVTERKRAEKEEERLNAQLVQATKMESVGRLAGGVAHDFNNLLMGILGYAELCREGLPESHPMRCYLDEIIESSHHSANLTRQLLAFARKQTIAPKILHLNDTVAGMVKLLGRLIGEDIELSSKVGENLWPVKIDPSQVEQILANLCINARDAIHGTGKIMIETSNVDCDEAYWEGHAGAVIGEYVRMTISDDGCGMEKDVVAHIFEPFFTTKAVGKGTGLGLATVYGIVKQNSGYISVYSEPGQGTTFKVYLPRVALAVGATPEAHGAPKAAPIGGRETILLVEDEKAIRATTRRFLEKLGYTVVAAESPEEALRLSARHPTTIHLLFSDVVMPGMDGQQLEKRLRETRPDIRSLFMSGYPSDIIAQRGVLEDGLHFLGKPFSRDELAYKVREILDEAARR